MLSGRTQRHAFASPPERRNENINLSKYFIFSSGDRTHNGSIPTREDEIFSDRFYSHTLYCCATTGRDCPLEE